MAVVTRGGSCGRSVACERRQREPWILVTSLGSRAAKHVMRCYQLRMQIEESFRDMKNARLGLHFRSAERLSILVLIGTLATVVAWLVAAFRASASLPSQYNPLPTRTLDLLCWLAKFLQPTGNVADDGHQALSDGLTPNCRNPVELCVSSWGSFRDC